MTQAAGQGWRGEGEEVAGGGCVRVWLAFLAVFDPLAFFDGRQWTVSSALYPVLLCRFACVISLIRDVITEHIQRRALCHSSFDMRMKRLVFDLKFRFLFCFYEALCFSE